MRRHLNGWHRIGIVASVLWALGGAWWANGEVNEWHSAVFHRVYSHCTDKYAPNVDSGELCMNEAEATADQEMRGKWSEIAAWVALAPIPLAWLLVYTAIGLWRWVKRGFASSA